MKPLPPSLKSVAHVLRRMTTAKWGGTETVVHQLARAYEARGIHSPVHCTSMLSQPGVEIRDTVQIHRHRYLFPWLGLSADDKQRLQLKGGSPLAPGILTDLLRQPGLSLIHTHVQLRLGGIARTAARLRRIPYVVSIHGGLLTTPAEQVEKMREPFAGKPEWGKAFGLLLGSRHVLRDAAAVICVGSDEAALMRAKWPNLRIEYIPNGVDTATFSSATPDVFLRDHPQLAGKPFLLCVSRIDFQKNQLLLVRAFAEFSRNHPHHHLVLIGPVTVEDYQHQIRQTAAELGIADRLLIIPGFSPGDPRLASAFAAAETFVLPTDHEPFGIVILEAWAAGKPVIATRVGGIPGFTTDGENIRLVPKGDATALATALGELAASTALREQLANAGRKLALETYDWSKVADRHLELYQDILSRRGAGTQRF
ncbi:MAG: glycosyltransferase family 4 protein [Candidatus Methylacidiphilales bacterium]|nr:glycosyltransferase family 4 protein [Candidatus Methylacidiphilales bacterium]